MGEETDESLDEMFREITAEQRFNFLKMYLNEQTRINQRINVLGRVIYELDGLGADDGRL
jgi:hypothetical protein